LAGVPIAPEAASNGGPGAGAVADAELVWSGLAP